jgi:hypothetical protein
MLAPAIFASEKEAIGAWIIIGAGILLNTVIIIWAVGGLSHITKKKKKRGQHE